jgi:hypothetical protein
VKTSDYITTIAYTCGLCGVSGTGSLHWCRATSSCPTPAICGVVSHSGAKGEPLACGFPFGHSGAHAWATLPTFVRTPEPTTVEVRV